MAQRIGSRPDLDALIVSSPVLATDVADPAVEASKAFSGQIDALAEKLPAVTWARAELSAMPDLASIFGIEAATSCCCSANGSGSMPARPRSRRRSSRRWSASASRWTWMTSAARSTPSGLRRWGWPHIWCVRRCDAEGCPGLDPTRGLSDCESQHFGINVQIALCRKSIESAA